MPREHGVASTSLWDCRWNNHYSFHWYIIVVFN